MSHVPKSENSSATGTLRALLTINRVPETLGYNIAYFAIGIGLAPIAIAAIFDHQFLSYLVLFLAVMLSKMQASVADALHDQDLDAENPEKSVISSAVDYLGHSITYTLLITEVVGGLVLWSWLSHITGSFLYICCGATLTFFGFIYSYPPRLKERGILNHVTTTSADIISVIIPVAVFSGADLSVELLTTVTAVFCYTFGYHIMHQSSDTFYDRKYGISTFTQEFGVSRSVLLSSVFTVFAGILSFLLGYFVATAIILLVGYGYWLLYQSLDGQTEKVQTDVISKWFNIGWIATFLNSSLAVSLLL